MLGKIFKIQSKKVISILLVLVMIVGILPVSVFADTSGNYSAATSVSAVLGETETFNGLKLLRMGDGDPVVTTAGGISCERTDRSDGGKIFMYFDIDDTFLADPATPLIVEVEYYDDGNGNFGISYPTSAGTSGMGTTLTDTKIWEKAIYTISDGVFNGQGSNYQGGINGADFRIGLYYPGGSENPYDICIKSVTVKKISASADYSNGVSAILGTGQEEVFSGLNLVRMGDGDPVAETIGGVSCERTDSTNDKYHMYFDIDDEYVTGSGKPIDVEVEYFDNSTGQVLVQYKDQSDEWTTVGSPNMTNSNTWKKVTLSIFDGVFSGGINGADIRIAYYAGKGNDLYVKSVTVKRFVTAALGTTEQFNGLSLLRMGDGDPVVTTAGAISCERTDKGNGKIFFYFDVDDGFINGVGNNVEVEVEYYDDNPGLFGIGYSSGGAGKGSESLSLTGSNSWKKKTFIINNADLNNTINNADFRVGLWSPTFDGQAATNKDICIKSVTLRKLPENPSNLLKVSVTSDKFGNIFTQDDTLSLDVNVNNNYKAVQDLKVNYSVLDANGFSVTSGMINSVNVGASASNTIPLDFDDIKKFGVYKLNLTLTSNANSEITVSGTYAFSRILSENRGVEDGIFGACTHFAQNKGDIEGNLEAAEEAGVKFIRDEMYWGAAETTKGVYQVLPSWDKYVDEALDNGIEPLVVLTYGNNLYGSQETPDNPEYINAFANYCKFIAQKYKNKVTHFEIWNEYNINVRCNRGGPEDGASYKALLEAAYNAIKSVYSGEESKVTVVGGVTAENDLLWIEDLLAAGGYQYMDAISVHPYSYPLSPESFRLDNEINKLDDLMIRYGGAHKPIWISEIGWPTNTSARGVSEYSSAVYGVKAYVLASINNLVEQVFWYDFQNDGTDTNDPEQNFGLIRSWSGEAVPGAAKVGYVAYSALSSKLLGMKYDCAYNDLDQSIKIYRFTPEDSSSALSDKLVLWTTGANKNVALDLGCASVDVSDMYGNKKTVYAIDGKVNLSLSEEPVYVEGAISETVQLAASPLQLEPATFNTIKGDTIQINADFTGTIPSEGAKYSLELPSGWTPVSDVPFTNVDSQQKISVAVPDLEIGTYEFNIYVKLNNGDEIAASKVTVNVVNPYSINIIPCPAVKGQWSNWNVKAEITNNTDTMDIGGNLQLLLPVEWASDAIDFTVAPRATKVVDIPVAGNPGQTLYNLKVRLTVDGEESFDITKKISFLGAEKAGVAPEIDGVFADSEWSDAMEFKLDNPSQVVNYEDYTGVDDLSTAGYLKWDSNRLYMAAAVKDDVHNQANSDGNIWNGDGIQFAIDPQRMSATKATAWNEIGMALNNQSVVNTYRWSAINGKTTGALPNMICSIVRDENTKTTIYEASIPWTDILPDGQTIDEGSDIGFSFLVNDSDGDGTSRGWIEYMSGIGLSKDPGQFGDLVLVDNSLYTNDLDLSGVDVNVAAGRIAGTSTSMEYCVDSADGTNGTWRGCTSDNTLVTFTAGKVYVREKGNNANFRLVATIAEPVAAPNLTYNDTTNTISGLNATYEYKIDNNGWTSGDVNGDFSGTHTVLVRVKATSTKLASAAQEIKFTTSSTGTGGNSTGGTGGNSTGGTNGGSTNTTTPETGIVNNQGKVTIKTAPVVDVNGTATVVIKPDFLEKAEKDAKPGENGVRKIEIVVAKAKDAEEYKLVLPVEALTAENSKVVLDINTELATLQIPSNILKSDAVAEQSYITFSIAQADTSRLPADVKVQISNRPVIELKMYIGNKQIEWNNPDAPVTVSFDYKPAAEELKDPGHIVVWYIDGAGKITSIPNARYNVKTGKVTFTTTHFSTYAVAYIMKTFSDLDKCKWAKEQIEVLASKGIIDTADKTYKPEANITRGEFIAYLVRALGISAKADGSFTDVKESHKYYKEIAIAKKLGIAVGYDNKFNPDKAITRQDMFVLTEKALTLTGNPNTKGSTADLKKFSDSSKIASYAKQSTANLVKAGIINGDGKGINPTSYTNKASAAVVIYNLILK